MPDPNDALAAVPGTPAGRVPIPDPTLLTTQQLIREILALREILEAKILSNARSIEGIDRSIDTKIGAVLERFSERFRSVEVQFSERDDRFATADANNKLAISAALAAAKEAALAIDEKTAHLQSLHGEKFASISTQFSERDVRSEQSKADTKAFVDAALVARDVAVAAALQAAKEAFSEQNRSSALAIAKSEAATAKSIDQLTVLLQTAAGALDGKIADIKDRITVIEGKTLGAATARDVSQGSQIQWVGIMGLVLGAVVGLGGILMAVTSGSVPPQPIVERVIIEPPGDSRSDQLRQQLPGINR